jgi:hypothetical protein
MPRTDPMDLLYSFEGQGQDALNNLKGLQSGFSGINSASDVKSRYGIKDIGSTYDPFFKNLAQNRARRLAGTQARAGRSASPEMSFSNVENDYEQGLNQLLGQKGQAEIGQQSEIANLLQNALSQNNQFGLQKNQLQGNMASNLFGNRLNLEQFNRQGEGPTWLDILGTIGGVAGKAAGGLVGAPSTTFDFGSTSPTMPKLAATPNAPNNSADIWKNFASRTQAQPRTF